MKAIWNGKVIAESDKTINIENNQYFPPESVNTAYLQKTDTQTTCAWKGVASYYNIVVDNAINENAAWYYPHPGELAKVIKNYVAFWRGVKITDK